MKEADIQRAIVDYCDVALVPPARCFAVPNAAHRTKTGRAANGVAGLLPGVSDLIVVAQGKIIFAEVKTPTGRVRESQFRFANMVRANGHHAAVWRGIDDVRDTFRALGVETREALQ